MSVPYVQLFFKAKENLYNRLPYFFGLTVKRLLWTKRTVAINVLVFFFFIITIGLQWYLDPESIKVDSFVEFMQYHYFGVPLLNASYPFVLLVTVVYASLLLAEDKEDHTLEYFFTKPISRMEILLYKFIPYVVVSTALLSIQIVSIYSIIMAAAGGWDTFVENIGMLAVFLYVSFLGVIAYGTFFMTIGIISNRPLLYGFIIGFLWEVFLALSIGMPIQVISIRHYLVHIMSYYLPERFFGEDNLFFNVEKSFFPTNVVDATATLMLISVIIFLIGWNAIRKMDIT